MRTTFMPAATPSFSTFTRCSCPRLGVERYGGDAALEPSSMTWAGVGARARAHEA
jgi:hypothetical protein